MSSTNCPIVMLCVLTAGSEGLRRAPLIPVDDGEVPLQRLRVLSHQRELGSSGAAVNKQNNGVCNILGTNENPLLGVVDWNLFKDSKTVPVAASVDSRS